MDLFATNTIFLFRDKREKAFLLKKKKKGISRNSKTLIPPKPRKFTVSCLCLSNLVTNKLHLHLCLTMQIVPHLYHLPVSEPLYLGLCYLTIHIQASLACILHNSIKCCVLNYLPVVIQETETNNLF